MKINYNDINTIYNRFVEPKQNPEFLNKYSELPLHLNTTKWRWEGKDLPRIISLLEFKEFADKNNFTFDRVLSINGANDPEFQYVNYKHIENYNYLDDTIKYDLHNLNLNESEFYAAGFDFFMCNQTLEHVYDPCLVLRNVRRVLRSGGIFYCNVPSFSMAHDTPHHHYMGITPVGLGCIVQQAGFKILDIGFWGNTEYINVMMNNNIWPDFRRVKNYKSEKNKEVISWIFAEAI